MGRKNKKVIQGILQSIERVLSRSQFQFYKYINFRRLKISTYALQKRIELLSHQQCKEHAIHDTIIIQWDRVWQTPNYCTYAKGNFQELPAFLRYMATYGPDLVLDFLKTLTSWDVIILKWPTLKTVSILALLPGHRCQ